MGTYEISLIKHISNRLQHDEDASCRQLSRLTIDLIKEYETLIKENEELKEYKFMYESVSK